jgi:Flp pilus assembly protein TadG
MRRSKTRQSDEGSAAVEFLVGAVLLLVPLVYLVLTLGALQAAAFATEGAARGAALIVVRSPDATTLQGRVDAAVAVALADFGVDRRGATVEVTCRPGPACGPAGEVTVSVRVPVPLPLLPDGLPLSLPVEGTATLASARFPGAS